MNRYGLEIPYAYEGDGVTVITPERAVRGQMYLCPNCNNICYVRRGDVKVAHFAHLAENKSCSISQETYEHMQAKRLIYNALSGDGTAITLSIPRGCKQCRQYHDDDIKLNARFGNPIIEHPIPTGNGGSIRADVAIEKEGKIRLVIEIVATHAVDKEKIEKLGDIRWIEVKASDVLEGGFVEVINSGNMKPLMLCLKTTRRHTQSSIDILWRDRARRRKKQRQKQLRIESEKAERIAQRKKRRLMIAKKRQRRLSKE